MPTGTGYRVLELTLPSLPETSHRMRFPSPIIFILCSTVDYVGDRLSMADTKAEQLTSLDLSGVLLDSTLTSPIRFRICCLTQRE